MLVVIYFKIFLVLYTLAVTNIKTYIF